MATRPYIPNSNFDNPNMQRPVRKKSKPKPVDAGAELNRQIQIQQGKVKQQQGYTRTQQAGYTPQTSDPYKQFEAAQTKANAANEARYKEGLGKYQQVEGIYGPKGTFGAGQEAAINAQKQQDVAAGTQSLVSSGMGNTTVAASLPQAWESNVGSQARLNLADTKAQGYAGALEKTAGFIERRTDQAPDMGQYANLVQQANTPYDTGGGQAPQPLTYQPQPAVNQAAQTYADTIRSAAQAKNLNNPNMRYPTTPLQPNKSMPQPVQQPIQQPQTGGYRGGAQILPMPINGGQDDNYKQWEEYDKKQQEKERQGQEKQQKEKQIEDWQGKYAPQSSPRAPLSSGKDRFAEERKRRQEQEQKAKQEQERQRKLKRRPPAEISFDV